MKIISRNRLEIFIKILIKNNIIGVENAITYNELYKICKPEFDNNLIEYKNENSFKGNMRFNVERCFNKENKTVKKTLNIVGKSKLNNKVSIYLKENFLKILKDNNFNLWIKIK